MKNSKKSNTYNWGIIFFIHEDSAGTDYDTRLLDNIIRSGSGKNNVVLVIHDTFEPNEQIGWAFKTTLKRLLRVKGGQAFNLEIIPEFNSDGVRGPDVWKMAFEFIFSNFSFKRKFLYTLSHGAAFGINWDATGERTKERLSEYYSKNGIHYHKPAKGEIVFGSFMTPSKILAIQNISSQAKNNAKNGLLSLEGGLGFSDRFRGLELGDIIPDPVDDFIETQRLHCKNLEILWISKLAKELEHCMNEFDIGKIDLIVMANCRTQIFENGFFLRKSVKYLIAPETNAIPEDFDSMKIMSMLNRETPRSTIAIAKKIVSDFANNNSKRSISEQKYSISLTHLKRYGKLFLVFEQINNILIADFPRNFNEVFKIRDGIRTVMENKSYETIDFIYWIRLVSHLLNDSKSKRTINLCKFDKIVKKTVIQKYVGKLISQQDAVSSKKANISGIAFYFPHLRFIENIFEPVCAYFGTESNEYLNKTKWDNFLLKYLKMLNKAEK